MSDGHMLVTFGAVENAATDVDTIANQITQELGDLHNFLAPLVASWEGTASGDWKTLQARWDNSADTLNGVLRHIAVALRTAASNYTATENANASIWG
jgi:WXG100 family type VII secretion target